MTRMNTRTQIASIFAQGGRLHRALAGYEERTQQREMAEAVASAFDAQERWIVEAATGTGKTVAYLVPAILSGRRTCVSTGTKTLQDQIIQKDIPMLREVIGRDFTAVTLKGRQNYLCLWQYSEFRDAPSFRRAEDEQYWPSIDRWAGQTETGDRAELSDLPDVYPTWGSLSVGTDACLGQKCAHYEDCFVVRARKRAAEADLIVVNHHLYFADLALRARERVDLLPDFDAVIFDEAHHIEETAAVFFGEHISNLRLTELVRDARDFLTREKGLSPSLLEALAHTEDRTNAFFGALARLVPEGQRVAWDEVLDADSGEELVASHAILEERLDTLAVRLAGAVGAGESSGKLAERTSELRDTLASLVSRADEGSVYVAEHRGRFVAIESHPVDVRAVMREELYRVCKTQIFTSATLTTDGHFGFFRRRMGMPKAAQELTLEPVFDYFNQALLYIPAEVPEPNHPQFVDQIAVEIDRLVSLTDGRALLLFTSYRNMNQAVGILGDRMRQDRRVLVQGEASKNQLLDTFRTDVASVLFATATFWEGVDVQGEALSLVTIDKLPFASPFDPVMKARLAHLEREGGNAFSEYQVPNAALALKQGVGRLIRHREDFGIISLFDTRILSRGYGKRFLDTLPRLRRTRDPEVVERWWKTKRDPRDPQRR